MMPACSSLNRNAAGSKIGASSAIWSFVPIVLLTCMVIVRSPVSGRDGVQKTAESPVKGVRLFEVSEMPGAGKLDIFCGRNVRRGFRHHRSRRVVVSGAGQQQRRNGNILQ